jgi:hypothetical protein
VSRTALWSTQPPLQWVPGILSLEVKRPGREAGHSPPSSAEVKNAWSYTSTPPVRLHGVGLVKHRDNFTFTFTVSVLSYFQVCHPGNIGQNLMAFVCLEVCHLGNRVADGVGGGGLDKL